jgi:hypothetical protein
MLLFIWRINDAAKQEEENIFGFINEILNCSINKKIIAFFFRAIWILFRSGHPHN